MEAKQEYVWAVVSAKDERVVALFATHTAAQVHRRRLGWDGYGLTAMRVWDESWLGIGAVLTLRPAREIHAVELH